MPNSIFAFELHFFTFRDAAEAAHAKAVHEPSVTRWVDYFSILDHLQQ